jgi:hypothetical protein
MQSGCTFDYIKKVDVASQVLTIGAPCDIFLAPSFGRVTHPSCNVQAEHLAYQNAADKADINTKFIRFDSVPTGVSHITSSGNCIGYIILHLAIMRIIRIHYIILAHLDLGRNVDFCHLTSDDGGGGGEAEAVKHGD